MKVSIVTPSFNQGVFIERTLQSVLSQDWDAIEYVVFDGGSSDSTIDVLRKYDGRIRWVSERDKGQGDAVNKGIQATDGEVIGWLNSDDIYYPGAVRLAVECLVQHPEAEMVYGMADHIDLDDRPYEAYPTEPWNFDRLQQTCFICQPALFFRRSVIEKHGLLDVSLRYCMDYEYWLRVGAAGVRFHYLEKKLAGSRMYPENKTMRDVTKVHAEINDMLSRRLGRVPDRWITNYSGTLVNPRIDRARHPRRYIYALVLCTALASLWWNWRISPALRHMMFEWLASVSRRS